MSPPPPPVAAAAASSSSTLTAEQKNATMSQERAFLTKLLEAAVQGQFVPLQQHVQAYQQQHSDLTAMEIVSQFRDAKRRTALHFACQAPSHPTKSNGSDNDDKEKTNDNDEDIVGSLLDWLAATTTNGNNSNQTAGLASLIRLKDKDGLTPLMLAAQVEPAALAERRVLQLLQVAESDGGAKLGLARSKAGATALHYAASAGATRVTVQALLHAGHIALSTFSTKGGTPLHWAVGVQPPSNHEETITALLQAGADPHAQASDPVVVPPPFHMAAAANHEAHAACLLEQLWKPRRGEDGNMSSWSLQPTLDYVLPGHEANALHMVADLNWVRVLHTCVQHNDNPALLTARNSEGWTPLQVAARERHVGCVAVLLAATNHGNNETTTEDDAQQYIREFHAKLETAEASPAPPPPERKLNSSDAKDGEKETKDDKSADDKQTKDDYYQQLEEAAMQQASALSSPPVAEAQQQEALRLKGLGNASYSQKQWQVAYDHYTAALTADPTNAALYSNRSACSLELANSHNDAAHKDSDKQPLDCREQALRDAVIARTLRPDWPKAAYRVAMARLALGRYEDAAVAAFEGLKQDSTNDELQALVQKCVQKGRQAHLQTTATTTTEK